MTLKSKILNYGLNLVEFTAYNFYIMGNRCGIDRHFNDLENKGYIKKIPSDFEPDHWRKETFYYVTQKGAESQERKEDYVYRKHKAHSRINHDTGVKHIALKFLLLGADVEFEYPVGRYTDKDKKEKTLYADIRVALGNRVFFVENDIKPNPKGTYTRKTLKYEQIKLPNNYRVLFFWSHSDYCHQALYSTLREFRRPELFEYHSKRSNYANELAKKGEFRHLDKKTKNTLSLSRVWMRDYDKWAEMHRKYKKFLGHMDTVQPVAVKNGKAYYKYRTTTADHFFDFEGQVWDIPNSDNKLQIM